MMMTRDPVITKQPSSEEWHIAVDPCLTGYMLIAENDRRLTRGLTRVEERMRERSLSKNDVIFRKRIAAMRSRTHEVVNGPIYARIGRIRPLGHHGPLM